MNPMVTVENRPVEPHFQTTLFAGPKRPEEGFCGQAAEFRQFGAAERGMRMKGFESGHFHNR